MYPTTVNLLTAGLVSAVLVLAQGAEDTVNNLAFVDMLIGSSNGGNVFAGASLPYGMAKAGQCP